MVAANQIADIFAYAHTLYDSAIERLTQGDIRDAAEKAWCATKRATDALILAQTGERPPTTAATTARLLTLAGESNDYETLVGRYFTRISFLHGSCFYDGNCNPIDQTERRIRETLDYIRDAESLAGLSAG